MLTELNLAHGGCSGHAGVLVLRALLPRQKSLAALNLSFNSLRCDGLSALAAVLGDLSASLPRLDLSHNAIVTLDGKELASLITLRSLTLSHNAIDEIPVQLYRLEALEALDLAHNQIPSLACVPSGGGLPLSREFPLRI